MSYWSQSSDLLEETADKLAARIIDEGITGPERDRMLERHSTYLRMAQEYWNWHCFYEDLAAKAEKETG